MKKIIILCKKNLAYLSIRLCKALNNNVRQSYVKPETHDPSSWSEKNHNGSGIISNHSFGINEYENNNDVNSCMTNT